MTDHLQHAKHAGHGDYERSDVGIRGVVYFLIGLAIACVFAYFVVEGLFWYLDKRFEGTQPPVSPLVTNAPKDTRTIPPQYGNNYEKYLKDAFPAPQLETDEQTELNKIRLREEDTLSTYGYVDKNSGTVRIPIDRAMELLAQRGLPVRSTSASTESASTAQPKAAGPSATKASGTKASGTEAGTKAESKASGTKASGSKKGGK
ncbi:MAG TPA: hypothetical protein VGG04_10615 [Candidatus Sulfotelmatobacter sp.]|jgi:hypothetical protein